MSDLLSSFFSGEITETYVNKIYKLMSIVVVFAVIWGAVELLDWYKFMDNAPAISKYPHAFYRYKIAPIIAIAGLAANLIWLFLIYQAWGHLKSYFETSDNALLHKGLKTLYTSTVLLLGWLIVFIINAGYRTFVL